MPSFARLAFWAASLATMVTAMPSSARFTDRQMKYHHAAKRQQEAALKAGFGDADVLQLYVSFFLLLLLQDKNVLVA